MKLINKIACAFGRHEWSSDTYFREDGAVGCQRSEHRWCLHCTSRQRRFIFPIKGLDFTGEWAPDFFVTAKPLPAPRPARTASSKGSL